MLPLQPFTPEICLTAGERVSLLGMARPRKDNAQPTTLRIDKPLLAKLREYSNTHPTKPTLTALVEWAIREWIDAHANEGKSPPRRK